MMMKYVTEIQPGTFSGVYSKKTFKLYALFIALIISSCSGTESVQRDEYLIRVEESVLMTLDFQREFETTNSACSREGMKQDASVCRDAKKQLLNQILEELVIIERSKELNITVTDSELEESVRRIKGDYPESEFENMLLEYSVSYNTWEKKLRMRLLVEKVIAEDLKKNINITADDISKYYLENIIKNDLSGMKNKPATETVVRNLRNLKAEETYRTWFESLQKKYNIEINNKQWEKILSS